MNKISHFCQISILALGLLLGACDAGRNDTRNSKLETARTAQLLHDRIAREELARSPETASRLGLPQSRASYDYTNKVDDRSQAAFERARLNRLERYKELERTDISTLPPANQLTHKVAQMALSNVIDLASFGHGNVSLGFSRPYAADQLSGAYIELQDLLLNRQPIRNKAEALAYMERLSLMGDAIDDDGRRLLADAAQGVTPPDFILDRMRELTRQLADSDGGRHPILVAFSNLSLGAEDISAEERASMSAFIEATLNTEIVPAYDRFGRLLDELSKTAPALPGIWSLPDGDAYYTASLRFYTGQTISPENLHQQGLDIVASISLQLDLALQEAGFPTGTIAERLEQVSQQPEQFFSDDPEGRKALLQSLSKRLDATYGHLSKIILAPPRTRVSVAQIPDFLSATAPGGYYAAAPADGTSPGVFFINLRDTNEWPAYSLPTLLYHEAIPGHHLESALTAELGNLSILRQLIWLPVYGEGWALYAEDLADEIGVYDDDPLGRIGYLQSLLFRAARLVTDTGLHHKKWSREEAIAYLVTITGQPRSAMETEVDRYTVWPGQAVSYMVGRQFIWRMRQRATKALGSQFDLKAFHQTILANGPRPLQLVEADIDAWIAETR